MHGEVEIDTGIRGGFQPRPGWHLIRALAERQHGVVSRSQLRKIGLAPGQIDRLVAAEKLALVHRGVYAVGHRRLTREGMWMAAVLAGGPGAVLSHESAAINWQLLNPFATLPSITTPGKGRRRPGIAHHAARLPADEVTTHDAIPTTTVARTLFDLAAAVDTHRLEGAIAEAEYRGYADSPSLPDMTARYHGSRGVAKLRTVLGSDELGHGITRSALEDRFIRFLDDRGLQRPELNAAIEIGEGEIVYADCLWRSIRLAVELDGRAAHERRRTFESDRRRDRRLSVAGLRPIRITSAQLGAPDELEADLIALGVGHRAGSRAGAPAPRPPSR